MRIIIDGDIVAFMAACVIPDDTKKAIKRADDIMTDIVESFFCDFSNVITYVKGDGNFRMDHKSYKSNRKGSSNSRPATLEAVRDHLGATYGALAHNAEADDYCVAEAQRCKDLGLDYVICTIDKDLRQMEGKHFNIKKGILDCVTPEQGYDFLLQQCLTGDAADGIDGIRGIGPKSAQKILIANPDEPEMAILEVYKAVYGEEGHRELEKCWNLVYMRRWIDELRLLPLPDVFTKGRRGVIPYG
jgi:hypothetical protein